MDEVKKPRERKAAATTDYVDTSIDAQRQYSENLFAKAEARVMKVLDEMVETKLKTALTTIRPLENKSVPVETRMTVIADKNQDLLRDLTRRMAALAMQYELASGLRVRSVHFDNIQGTILARPLVHNI